MDQISKLLSLVDAYKLASDRADATISMRIFNDGKRIAEIRNGSDVGVRRIERAMQWFSDNWPEGVDWPANIPRPVKKLEAAE